MKFRLFLYKWLVEITCSQAAPEIRNFTEGVGKPVAIALLVVFDITVIWVRVIIRFH